MSDNPNADDSSTDYPSGYPDIEQHDDDYYEIAIPLARDEGGRRQSTHCGGVITIWLSSDQLRSWLDRIADELAAGDLLDDALASADVDVRDALSDFADGSSSTAGPITDSPPTTPILGNTTVEETSPSLTTSPRVGPDERFERTGHSPPNHPDEATVVEAVAESVRIGSHHCHPVTVETEESERQMYECINCGVTSNSITRFRQDHCDGLDCNDADE